MSTVLRKKVLECQACCAITTKSLHYGNCCLSVCKGTLQQCKSVKSTIWIKLNWIQSDIWRVNAAVWKPRKQNPLWGDCWKSDTSWTHHARNRRNHKDIIPQSFHQMCYFKWDLCETVLISWKLRTSCKLIFILHFIQSTYSEVGEFQFQWNIKDFHCSSM